VARYKALCAAVRSKERPCNLKPETCTAKKDLTDFEENFANKQLKFAAL